MSKGCTSLTLEGGTLKFLLLCALCLAITFIAERPLTTLTALSTTNTRMQFGWKENPTYKNPEPRSFEEATDYANMMVEQKRRRELIKKACTAANISRQIDIDHGGVFKNVGHLLVDDKYKILFGFIPKVGCTTWKGVINRLRSTHKDHLAKVGTLRNFKDNHTEIYYRIQNYRKVLFVREPITRMLSGYLSKLKNFKNLQRVWEQYIGAKIVRRYRGYDHAERYRDETNKPFMNITLSEYIQFITDIGSKIVMEELNDHWLPLHVVSNPCQISYDFIGHYENLAIEGPFVLKWLGVDHLAPFPQVHESHASNEMIKEYSQVSLSLLKRISDYYAFDYKAFGYHVNDTLSILMNGIFDEEEDVF
ncbi:carbohydrate sulfotransferase 14-like [Lytechinus variegatus]|uniref:carbohydrate sulfotransferase 14-like n=1 Tax=Lytechinus variegatus TaxID=7654 RepID=UPI001BB204E7|nr:carbohydrate sulfotransferase 14-like [Lytechinus variegatus]XP_041484445.1 carbohydrate sulfotransferase 14-like [Lytechinus variegatus]